MRKLLVGFTGLLFLGGAALGVAPASAATQCEERGVQNGPLTGPVHDNHEIAGEEVGEIIHHNVEPLTCNPPQVP